MSLRLAALKAACDQVYRRAYEALTSGTPAVAEATAETALIMTALLLRDDAEVNALGWQRAASQLTNLRQRIVLDGLGTTRAMLLLVRLAGILDLPDIAGIESTDEIQQTIRAAIAVGAPRYNAGDIRGCCGIYWATQHTLLGAPVLRGIPGYSRTIAPMRELAERAIPPLPLSDDGIDALAWDLRRAFDEALQNIGG
jgi:hypothetical protein